VISKTPPDKDPVKCQPDVKFCVVVNDQFCCPWSLSVKINYTTKKSDKILSNFQVHATTAAVVEKALCCHRELRVNDQAI